MSLDALVYAALFFYEGDSSGSQVPARISGLLATLRDLEGSPRASGHREEKSTTSKLETPELKLWYFAHRCLPVWIYLKGALLAVGLDKMKGKKTYHGTVISLT